MRLEILEMQDASLREHSVTSIMAVAVSQLCISTARRIWQSE